MAQEIVIGIDAKPPRGPSLWLIIGEIVWRADEAKFTMLGDLESKRF